MWSAIKPSTKLASKLIPRELMALIPVWIVCEKRPVVPSCTSLNCRRQRLLREEATYPGSELDRLVICFFSEDHADLQVLGRLAALETLWTLVPRHASMYCPPLAKSISS